MPQSNNPKAWGFVYPLSKLNEGGTLQLVRFRCRCCKATRHHFPIGLVQLSATSMWTACTVA